MGFILSDINKFDKTRLRLDIDRESQQFDLDEIGISKHAIEFLHKISVYTSQSRHSPINAITNSSLSEQSGYWARILERWNDLSQAFKLLETSINRISESHFYWSGLQLVGFLSKDNPIIHLWKFCQSTSIRSE